MQELHTLRPPVTQCRCYKDRDTLTKWVGLWQGQSQADMCRIYNTGGKLDQKASEVDCGVKTLSVGNSKLPTSQKSCPGKLDCCIKAEIISEAEIARHRSELPENSKHDGQLESMNSFPVEEFDTPDKALNCGDLQHSKGRPALMCKEQTLEI